MANGGNGEGGFQRSPNTYSGDRGGPAEDEALLAELRAISMKSGRSRFAEGTTNDDDDGNGNGNGDADEIAEIAEIGGVATRGGGDRTAPRSTAAADEGFCAVARNCDDELGGGEIAPLEKGNETPDIPDGSARHDGDRADDDIADAPSLERIDGLIIEGGGGVHATPPNTFTGDRGGDALDDDLLAELKAISVGSSGGNRFDGDGKGDDGTPSDDRGRECTEIGQISLPPTLGGSRGTNDKSDKKSRPLPPWKKKGAKKKSDADDDDMDIVVAVPHALVVANPIHVATFFKEEVESKGIATRDSSEPGMAEKCKSFEEDLSKFSSVKELGIQSNFPKTFVGDRGGAAEDADLLAELRAISNKSSSSNRFDGDNDDSRSSFSRNDNYSSIGLSESDAFVTKKPTSTNSGNEKQTRPLPPWKKKNAKKKSMMDDRMNIAAETPSMSAPLNPSENVMIGECDVSEYDVSADTGDAHAVLMDNSKSLDEKKTADFFENNDACLMKTVPPWKQKDSKAKYLANDNADVVIAAPPAASEANNEVDDDEDFFPNTNSTDLVDDSLPPTNTFTGVRGGPADDVSDTENVASTLVTGPPLAASVNLPKTFKGDRGGNAEDEALLAELRAISMRSSSNRFAGDEGDVAESKIDIVTGSVSIKSVSGENTHNSIKSTEATKKSEETSRPPPPWKRIGAKKATVGNELDAIIAAPPAPAEDRGDTNNHQQHTITMGVNSNDTGGFQRPPINTYTGDRGGNAEDEALLAELRAISMRSSSNRFAGVEGDVAESKIDIVTGSVSIRSISGENDDVVAPSPRKSTESTKKAKMTSRPLPPWKRICAKKATVGNELDVVIAVPPAPVEDRRDTNFKQQHTMAMAGNCNDAGGFQRPPVNTYTGDRGGSAEDEALLAELRAISMKSSSNRFAGDEGDVAESKIDIVTVRSMSGENTHNSINSAEATKNSEETSRPLPPWKRIGAKKATIGNELDAIIAAPPAPAEDRGDSNSKQQHTITMGVNSNDTGGFQRPPINTYTGDRGGSAEDEALLAELRAISMKSSSNRFAGDVVEVSAIQTRVEGLDIDPKATSDPGEGISSANNCSPSSVSVLPSVPLGKLSSGQDGDSMAFGGMGPPLSNNQDEIVITLEDLDETLKSSNWQLRKASYIFLHERMRSLLVGSEPMNLLNAIGVYSSLDQAIIHALNDKNAGALDAALTLSITYADTCQCACSDDAASQIMIALLKGPAFLSTRSSTLSSTEELVLKLIEIAPDGSASIQDIIDLIRVHGLKSVKPKVVIFSAKLILKAVLTFGASILPIPALTASSESLVAHSNAQAREIGMQLLAEICRALGSKGPLQSLVDKLKKAQQSQLDTLLEMSATVPSKSLRRNMGQPISVDSPGEALAALKKSQEEDEARRLASRPAVNLFQVLPQTCYSQKIKLEKWSEKVAALDALIGAGGEQPFKLCQPTSTIDYTQLIRELKKLLCHTHFAVCSKALVAFGMLAEGVGEQLSPNMRPLILIFVALFKDKKIINAVGSCLDKMFANVFSFEHLLDSKDSLPSSVDEKKQKNALVRKNCLEYLTRCVQSSGSFGTRGGITVEYATDLSKLACESLTDSDAATRKAGSDLLLALLNGKDEMIVSATKNITSSLQTTNPRALKSLMLATNGCDEAPSRPQSAPGKSSSKVASQEKSSERTNKVTTTKSTADIIGPPRTISSCPGVPAENADEKQLPSYEDSVENLSVLNIPKWGEDLENGGILVGIQSSNWKARVHSMNQLAEFYRDADCEIALLHTPSLFVVVRDFTNSFKDLSNFNVAKAMMELFTVIFGIYSTLARAPDGALYFAASKLAVEKIGDKKLYGASSSCLHSICVVKDPQRVLAVSVKTIGDIKSPMVHEAFLGWFKSFCLDFGAASLSKGLQDSLLWVLKECESNNLKVRDAALDVIGVMHTQLGPVLQGYIKSKDIQSSTMSLLEKVISGCPHDAKAQLTERMLKCVTLSVPKNVASQPNSSILSIPTTDLVASLKSDYLSRLNSTDGKVAWKIRRDALEEVKMNVDKCGGLIATDGISFPPLKQLFAALCSRLNDSQSNLKPVAATLIGTILSHVDDDSQAKLGRIVFAALLSAAMNDMKKTMRDAALSALSVGTERSKQNGEGTNLIAIECLTICLESALSEAALKSSGLPDVLYLLSDKLDSLYSAEKTEKPNSIVVHTQLAKVIVLCLLSSKSEIRSATDKLLTTCTKSGIVPLEDIDNEIRKLLPAQQRTVRSIIPKISKQDQELVDSFRQSSSRASNPIRPSSSRQQPVRHMIAKNNQPNRPSTSSHQPGRQAIAKSNQVSAHDAPARVAYDETNPLHSSSAKSTKEQRLTLLSRGDHWPEYPEEPGGSATLQTICKSWSQLISTSSIQVLFPNGGIRSHEDAVGGCELLSRSIEYSDSFLLQLDLIFKWTACALFSRDHTSGLRSLLSMLQLLLRRLRELSYVIHDFEATILLPSILEKAGIAKSQFRDQFLDVLSLIRSEELYPLQRYGSIICMSVIAKSKSSRACSLAASECSSCVKAVGTAAIGRKGVETLAKALSHEKVIDIRMSYLDLFDSVVQKSSLERVLELCTGDSITDKTKDTIIDRCSKRPSTAPVPNHSQSMHQNDPKQLRLRTPSRSSVTRTSSVSPRSSKGASDQSLSSSSAVTGALKSRLQRLRDENQTGGSLPCPAPKPSNDIDTLDIYTNTLNEIRAMINGNVTSEKGLQAIHRFCLAAKNNNDAYLVGVGLNASHIASLRRDISSDLDIFVETLANALKFAFVHGGEHSALSCPLIEETVEALTYVFRTPEYSSSISQQSLECCLREAVHALLDDRLDASKGAKADGTGVIVKAINKLAMRAAASPPRETSLLALISLQRCTISSVDGKKADGNEARASRVYTKLFQRIMKDEHEKSPTNLLGDVSLDVLLYSLDWLLQTVEEIRLAGESYELFKNADDMSKDLMTELVMCRGDSVRDALSQLELPEGGLVEKLLVECEYKMGLRPPQYVSVDESGFHQGAIGNSESKEARFAELVNTFAEAEEGSDDKQIALIALIEFKKANDIDLGVSLSHLSSHFKDFILDQVSKASKENSTEDAMGSFNERMRNLRLKVGQDQVVEKPPVADKAASLRARLEALKHSSCEVMVEKS